ncbi:hypothetical protein Mlab_0930 [Methanocorpusculum labreanum Z]|uniref:Uncharacterized protein n=1 Tax=Methanocorpusculum labreanum (strain ATCC 43576 / DSM 4855 / Z) TaxID=410358 RepID=A2SRZ5_METLZ|nr:hypothetical protein Mlab_0930 [Methanocorpusculum labreanum Z]
MARKKAVIVSRTISQPVTLSVEPHPRDDEGFPFFQKAVHTIISDPHTFNLINLIIKGRLLRRQPANTIILYQQIIQNTTS